MADEQPAAKRRRTLPSLSEVADAGGGHVFIPLADCAAKIDELWGESKTVFIRGGVAVGKSTMAAYLAKNHSAKYVNVPFTDAGKEEAWKAGTIGAVSGATGEQVDCSDGLGFRNALKLAADKGRTLIYDEAHTLFTSDFLCASLFKGDATFRPRVLLFSAAGEAAAGGTAAATPAEITQKFMWVPPMPEANALQKPLKEAGVKLDKASIDFFLKFCAGHYGIFMAAMHWVKGQQRELEWDFGTTVREVRASFGNEDWGPGKILAALAESRAVKVNGRYSSLDAIPEKFAKLLCEGPTKLNETLRKELTIHGFVLPQADQDVADELRRLGLHRFNWTLPGVPYRVANPLLATYYRRFLKSERGLHCQLRESAELPESCADLLLRAVPYLTFPKVTGYEVEGKDPLSAAHLPFEDQYNSAIREVLESLGYQPVAPQSSAKGEGKPDCIVELKKGDGTVLRFVMEGAVFGADINEHRGRFDKQERYKTAAHKALYIIGAQVEEVRKAVKAAHAGGVEIIGLVPNRAHSHYTVLVRTKDADAGCFPFEFGVDCDLVARGFKVKDGAPDIQCVQELKHINPPQGVAPPQDVASDEIVFAKRQRDSAQGELESAVGVLKSARKLLARAMDEDDATKVTEAEQKVAAAKKEVHEAEQKVHEAEQKIPATQ